MFDTILFPFYIYEFASRISTAICTTLPTPSIDLLPNSSWFNTHAIHILSLYYILNHTQNARASAHQEDYIEDDEFDFVPDLPQLNGWSHHRPSAAAPPTVDVISKVSIAPFTCQPVVRRNQLAAPHSPAADVVSMLTHNPDHRKFMNPVSYLGGPLLEPRNRKSLDSMLSVD